MSTQILSRWGIIGVTGEDAAAFLQSQLSNDVASMSNSTLRMAGLCTAKGRLLGSFFMLRQDNQILLVCRKETIPALVKRLNMFVLRSKCKISDDTANYQLAYFAESGVLEPMKVQWDTQGKALCSLRILEGVLPGFELTPSASLNAQPSSQYQGDDAFEFTLQQLGIAYISLPTVEMFIPQAINFDLVGGVSFNKGCYPGQEIVARSHYLGKVKRRVFQATAKNHVEINAGQDIWLEGKNNEPVGQVATAVILNGQYHLLVELAVDDAEQESSVFTVRNDAGDVALLLNKPPYDVHQKGNLFELS